MYPPTCSRITVCASFVLLSFLATAPASAQSCVKIEILPEYLLIPPGESRQLEVTCTSADGTLRDVAAAAEGTTYAVEPAGIVTVAADGEVTALDGPGGDAEITVMNGLHAVVIGVSALPFVDLGDLIAGGDGTGTGGGERGSSDTTAIHLDTGELLTVADMELYWLDTFDEDGVNPSPVDDSDFVDSVFFILAAETEINSAGVQLPWPDSDVGPGSLNHVLSNYTHQIDPNSVAFPGNRAIRAGRSEHWTSAVGIHGAAGVTFDLGALREEYGSETIHTLSVFVGKACEELGFNSSTHFIIYSDEDGIVEDPNATADQPYFSVVLPSSGGEFPYMAPIPPEATFLTLAVGSGGGSLNCDIGVFANARILPERAFPCATIAVRPGDLTVPRGNSVQLEVSCRDQLGMPHDITSGAAGTVYSADPPGVVEVGADGLVTAVGSGDTEITVTNGELAAVIGARVSSLIDLGDVVAGGDGTGTGGGDRGTREFTAIDADSGLLVREDELIFGNTADTDGVNPVPVDESEFVDVVFFVNSPLMPINSEQVEFQWQDGDADDGFMQVLSNFSARLEGGDRAIAVGNQEFETAVGIHAAIGITFDLDALREEFGPEAVGIFSTFAGNSLGDCGTTFVRMYIIYSDADGIIEDPGAEGDFPYWSARLEDDTGVPYEQPIPPEASFLTLAVGAAEDGIACDAAVFADPRIRSLPPTESDFTRGDANADGGVDLSDGVIALNFLFGGGVDPVCLKAFDANDGGSVDLTDAVYLLNGLFSGGPLPPAPYPGCGPDPTVDDLSCDAFPPCG